MIPDFTLWEAINFLSCSISLFARSIFIFWFLFICISIYKIYINIQSDHYHEQIMNNRDYKKYNFMTINELFNSNRKIEKKYIYDLIKFLKYNIK